MERLRFTAKAFASKLALLDKSKSERRVAALSSVRSAEEDAAEAAPSEVFKEGKVWVSFDMDEPKLMICTASDDSIIFFEEPIRGQSVGEQERFSFQEWAAAFDLFQPEGPKMRLFHMEDPEKSVLFWPRDHDKQELVSWRDSIKQMRIRRFLDKIDEVQKKALEELKRQMFVHKIERESMVLYQHLKESNFNVEQAKNAVLKDEAFRADANLNRLNSVTVYELLRSGLALVPGSYDRKGRPVVFFRAARHFPGDRKFVDILKLVLYLFEKSTSLCISTTEIAIVEQLEGATRANQDTRLVKFLVEVQKGHYPGIVGEFYAVNCPWYYPMLIAIVKPWLSKELAKKLHTYSSSDQLQQQIRKDMLTTDLGGDVTDDIDAWIAKLMKCENLTIDDLDNNAMRHEFGESVLAIYDDKPAYLIRQKARKCGTMKKKGNWVGLWNSRFVVLTEKILYYYKGEEDLVAEGAIILRGANVTTSGTTNIVIVTAEGKVGTFSAASESEAREWAKSITAVVAELSRNRSHAATSNGRTNHDLI